MTAGPYDSLPLVTAIATQTSPSMSSTKRIACETLLMEESVPQRAVKEGAISRLDAARASTARLHVRRYNEKGDTMNRTEATEYARRWTEAWNKRDIDAVLEHFEEDVVFSSPRALQVVGMPTVHGKAALGDY